MDGPHPLYRDNPRPLTDDEKRQWKMAVDRLGNRIAREGCDRCYCGCKYWEGDHCVDCGQNVQTCLNDPDWVKENRP